MVVSHGWDPGKHLFAKTIVNSRHAVTGRKMKTLDRLP